MKNRLGLALAVSGMVAGSAWASMYVVDISPGPGEALNLGSTTYTQDHALGIAAPNTAAQAASSATGGEIGSGITYDDVSNTLSFEIGYGSDWGFTDLVGDYSISHFHGPSAVDYPAVNTSTGVYAGQTLTASHIAGSSAKTGYYIGTWVLTDPQEQDLFDNEIYINIHSTFVPAGEIRGQLVIVPEPATIALAGFGLVLLVRRRVRRA